jgi:hypothetical protein
MPQILSAKIRRALAERDIESPVLLQVSGDGTLQIGANRLVALALEGEQAALYAAVPVTISINLDGAGEVLSVSGDSPTADAVADAADFIRALKHRGALRAEPPAKGTARQTHEVIVDARDRRIVRRARVHK